MDSGVKTGVLAYARRVCVCVCVCTCVVHMCEPIVMNVCVHLCVRVCACVSARVRDYYSTHFYFNPGPAF